MTRSLPRRRTPSLPVRCAAGGASLWATLAAGLLLLAGCASERGLQLVSGAGAVYPPAAREAGIEGYAVVRYDVDAEGRVQNARVVDAQPPGVFDDSALQAVSRWRFRPLAGNSETRTITGLESRIEFTQDGGDRYEQY